MDKPYYSLNDYFQNEYGEKCYKIAIDAGLSCPNRDGTIGYGGCTFCSAGGSGDFAVSRAVGSISEQIATGLALFGDKKVGEHFVAYYQAYTNTYGEISHLEALYREGLSHPQIIGISIATRPDCISGEVLDLLVRLRKKYAPKFIWIELGLQTCHERTAGLIRRGYPLSVFENAMKQLVQIKIPVIVHVILGLPGETAEDMYETVSYLNRFSPFGVKLQLLHILENTRMAVQYGFCNEIPVDFKVSSTTEPSYVATNEDSATSDSTLPPLHILELDEYINIVIHCLEILDPATVIHRLTGDGPKEILLAPKWSLNKRNVLNTLHKELRQRQTYQGRLYYDSRSTDTL